MLDTQTLVLLAVIAVAFIALVVWFIYQRTQSLKLQERFGPEYDRTVDRLGSQAKAEAELRARERRVEKFNIVSLAPAEASRFSQSWSALQSHFVDDPKGTVGQADALVRELMLKRGFPCRHAVSHWASASASSITTTWRASRPAHSTRRSS